MVERRRFTAEAASSILAVIIIPNCLLNTNRQLGILFAAGSIQILPLLVQSC
jgi:hypothetical protein